ncbi:hypothetical protein MYCOZU2_05877 (plasmid) [Mycobacterium intracellulare subsp. chimaera]|uniref:Uncharacterized protein n=1 Tax=Mycobacterium intracellulare subsp. chimaera TaxID=222805 RepID=A0A7U5MR79_MYCIT|nr:hypothetical protein MYCOZU2_05877 [Mycobacterium intracellulare subsp. chimaera]
MITHRSWLGISNRECLIESDTRQPLLRKAVLAPLLWEEVQSPKRKFVRT